MWLEPVEEEEEPVGRRLRLGRLKMMALVPVLMITMLDVANALKIQDVTFPEYAMLGQTVTLVCDYRLDDKEFVDSVKWYKDGKEFYRILPNAPREQDRTRVFKHSGINLDMKKSGVSSNSSSVIQVGCSMLPPESVGNSNHVTRKEEYCRHSVYPL